MAAVKTRVKTKFKSQKPKTKSKPKSRAKAKKKTPAKKISIIHEAQMTPHKIVPGVCRSCHALPIGAVELVSLLLIMTLSLSAVLLTSVYALEHQSQEIEMLKNQLR